MKKTLFYALSAIAVGIITFNYSVSPDDRDKTQSFKIGNLKAMQASAGEWNCDRTVSQTCTTPTEVSHGRLTYISN